MKLLVIALFSVLTMNGFSQSTTTPATQNKRTVEEEVLQAESAQRDAYLKRDIEATERLVADEFVLTVPDGGAARRHCWAFSEMNQPIRH